MKFCFTLPWRVKLKIFKISHTKWMGHFVTPCEQNSANSFQARNLTVRIYDKGGCPTKPNKNGQHWLMVWPLVTKVHLPYDNQYKSAIECTHTLAYRFSYTCPCIAGWQSGRVLDLQSGGWRFESHPGKFSFYFFSSPGTKSLVELLSWGRAIAVLLLQP